MSALSTRDLSEESVRDGKFGMSRMRDQGRHIIATTEARSHRQKAEIRGQRADVRNRRSKCQRSEVRDQKLLVSFRGSLF
jgi:hypothetical protein